MTFAARAEPQVHQYKLDKPHKLDMLKSNKNISNMVIYVYRIYTSCKHVRVCVCVVDIHVVHCFYEVRKYKYHSGRVICPNFLSRGMNLEKEKNLWSISLSMTHGPTYPYRKKTPKKNNTCTSHNYII